MTPINIYGPPNPPKPTLKFGLELEFAIAILPPHITDPHPFDPRSAKGLVLGPHDSQIANLPEHVAATISSFGLSAVASSLKASIPLQTLKVPG